MKCKRHLKASSAPGSRRFSEKLTELGIKQHGGFSQSVKFFIGKMLSLKRTRWYLIQACLLSLFLSVFFSSCKRPQDVIGLSSLAETDTILPGWQREQWGGREDYYSFVPSDRSEYMALVIETDTTSFGRWYFGQLVEPYSSYRFSGWIKTENVESDYGGGAGFRFGRLEPDTDAIFRGNTPWTYVEKVINTEGDDSILIELLLGKGARARGKVFFDQIQLEWLSSKRLAPEATIETATTLYPMSEKIFSQFTELMGRGFYGGKWAEIIEDRKFLYAPGHRRSPWKIIGDSAMISMNTRQPFVGEHSPVIINSQASSGNGLLQEEIGLHDQMYYEGRIILQVSEKDALPVLVELVYGEDPEQSDRFYINDIEPGTFHTIQLRLRSQALTDSGKLRILPLGKGEVKVGTLSLMPENNIDGFRPDVLELLRKLDAPVYRWPGGNFVSGYDWRDGIGDPDKRPPRFERAWGGVEPNDVGIHEFMRLMELLGAEANIVVNTGLGTPELAAKKVQYVNGRPESPMGALRVANGRREPWGVRLWGVGNEMFGDWQLGHMPIEDYVIKHNRTSDLMWKEDPDIKLMAVGFPGRWNDMMYTHSLDHMTIIKEHIYRQDWHAGGLMTHVRQMPDAIRSVAEEHRRARRELPGVADRNIKVAMTEWNYWYGPHIFGLLGTRYFLQDALGIAAGINEYLRQSDVFYMANYAQTVNVIGAIKATETTAFMEGTGLVLQLYRREFGLVPVKLTGDTAPLDVASSITCDGKYLTISVINPTNTRQRLRLNFDRDIPRRGVRFTITGQDRYVYNDVGQQEIQETATDFVIRRNSLEVPPMSANIYRIQLLR